jgi:hypothetical protein
MNKNYDEITKIRNYFELLKDVKGKSIQNLFGNVKYFYIPL